MNKMVVAMNDGMNILQKALEAFKKETGINATYVNPETAQNFHQFDAKLKLLIPGQDYEIEYFVDVKKRVTKTTLGGLEHVLGNLPERTLLVTEYVAVPTAERLRELNIQFLDEAGNAYLNAFPLYIYVKGNKRPYDFRREIGPRAFNRTGLKVVFALLCQRDLVNRPLREIADAANVALGTVDIVFKDLKRMGYLIEIEKRRRRIVQKEKLIQQWTEAYPEKLRPKIILGRYTTEDKFWWKDTMLPHDVYWGGETAAAKITGYLKPEEITIYAPEMPNELLLRHRLRKDPKGEIKILKAFWKQTDQWNDKDTVHPLLIYADLLATADSRNIETAKMIYQNEIIRYI